MKTGSYFAHVPNLCVAGVGCSTSPETLKKFNNNVTTVGLDVMLRYPLFVSAQFTKGRLQPYLSAGPAIFVTTLKDTDNFIPAGQSSTYTSLGVKAGAGLMLFLTNSIGAFIEYRDSNFQVKNKYYNATVVHDLTLGKTLGNATFNTQAIIGGISFSF
ncbi:MAG: outer membrane beta-barrel protein [Legionellales bacterium]|nr:outer membrane beta-barrel protein [Legionellales bacterium]